MNKGQFQKLEKVQVSYENFLVTPEGDILQNGNQVVGLHCEKESAHIKSYFDLHNYHVVKTLVYSDPLIPGKLRSAIKAVCDMEDLNLADIAIDHAGLPVLLFMKMVEGKEKMPDLIIDQLIQDFNLNRRYLYDFDDQEVFDISAGW